MFATKCLSYKLASPTLADLTRAKKVLRYLKGTRELNLYLTIPAVKPNDLNKTLKHITGYSDADWAGDPVTRKSTSFTLCYVDQFLLTSECRGQGTVALSSGESEMYALGALSAELIFAQAILKEIGLSFLIHARADSSTARAVATKQGASRKMKHIHSHEIPIHSRFGISETFNNVISQDRCESKWHWNESTGTREIPQFEINAWHGNRAERYEFTWQMVQSRRMTVEISGYEYDGLDESNDRQMWACVDFWKFSQCNEGRLANLTQPRDARRRACWTRVTSLHSGHIRAWHNRHDSDILLCTETSWAQVGSHRKQVSSLCTAHFAHVLCRLPRLHKITIRNFYSTDSGKFGIKSHLQTLQGHVAPHQNSGKKGSIARSWSKVWTSWAQSVCAYIWGKNTRRNLATRKMHPQSSMGLGKKVSSSLKNSDKATFYTPVEAWVMPGCSSKKPEER